MNIYLYMIGIFVDIAHIVNTLLHILVHVYMFKFVLIVNKLCLPYQPFYHNRF